MDRIIEGFFYGLFMSTDLLRKNGASPVNPRCAYVDGFSLQIGNRATLVPIDGRRSYGMLIGLTHAELDRLYAPADLCAYRPEPVLAQVIGGPAIPALCYNLPVVPAADEHNVAYAERLQNLLRNLAFPAEYIDSLSR